MKVDDVNFPKMKVYVSVVDEKGKIVPDIKPENYAILQDDKPITDFSVEQAINDQQPLALVLAVDVGTMSSEEAFKRQIDAAVNFVASLKDQDKLAIVAFSDEIKTIKELSVDKHTAKGLLTQLKAAGPSKLYDALIASVKILKDQPEPKAIVLISNGTDSQTTTTKAEDFFKAALNTKIQVFPLGYGDIVDPAKLDDLAKQTGGVATYLPGKKGQVEELKEAADKIIKQLDESLRKQYLLQYESKLKPYGDKHTVKVSLVKYKGWEADDTKEFTACKGLFKICMPPFILENTVASNGCITPVTFPIAPPLKQLEGWLDGSSKSFCSDKISPIVDCCLDPANVTEGTHSFKLVALDSADNSAEISLSLMVRPVVKFEVKEPKSGDTIVGSKLKLVATLDSILPLNKVQVKVGEKVLKEFTNPKLPVEGPAFKYLFNEEIDLQGAPIGDQVFYLLATDEKDYTTSFKEDVKVSLMTAPPSMPWGLLISSAIVIAVVIMILLASRKRRSKFGGGLAAGDGTGAFVLHELEGLYPNQTWPLEASELRLGRKPEENDVPLKGLNASRKMAVIRCVDGQHFVFSLNPQNPVLVNNVPVYQQQALQNGDHIRMGESLFQYEVRA